MQKYIIGVLLVVILVLTSLLYKTHTTGDRLSVDFPIKKENTENPKLYLYVFFSKKNCRDCLGIIEVLNQLPSSIFVVRGAIPGSELQDIDDVRAITGATFPIESQGKFKKLVPIYTPSVVGLSKESDLFFVLPGVPGEKEYLKHFLDAFFSKIYPYLTTL